MCKIGLEDDAVCSVCIITDEGLLHLFFYCEKLTNFMSKIKTMVKYILKEKWNEQMTQRLGNVVSFWIMHQKLYHLFF